jgi:hypothetical protein
MARGTKLPFSFWMKAVDAEIMRRAYMTSGDLPDVCYRDWYDDGCTPKNAAARAIRYAKNDC